MYSFTDLIALIPLFAAPVSPTRPDIPEDDREYDPPDYQQEPSASEEEYARNSAAAREVAREMDSLQFSPPGPLPSSQQQQTYQQHSGSLQSTRPLSIGRSPSPLSPPTAPFAQPRSVSPNPGVGSLTSPRAESPRVGGAMGSPMLSDASYATPPEYPVPSSSSSVSVATASTGGGPRMISAAAFKRAGRSGSDADMTKKRPLPSSPYPVRTASSGPAYSSSQDNLGGGGRPGQQLPPGGAQQVPVDHAAPKEPDSPVMSDYGVLGNVRVANSDGSPPSPGYNQNHFVTNLED